MREERFHYLASPPADCVVEMNFVNGEMLPGLYPESHGIVGNQFYDGDVHSETRSSCKAFFNIDDERCTKHMKWWQKDDVEPIWATAAKNNVKFATFLWGRCDVPYDDVKRLNPEHCENYYSADLTKTLRINVDKALSKIQDGVDAAIVSISYSLLLLVCFC